MPCSILHLPAFAGIVIVALLIRYFAPGWTMVKHAAKSADPDLRDVALISGASRWQTLRHVLWPQIAVSIDDTARFDTLLKELRTQIQEL